VSAGHVWRNSTVRFFCQDFLFCRPISSKECQLLSWTYAACFANLHANHSIKISKKLLYTANNTNICILVVKLSNSANFETPPKIVISELFFCRLKGYVDFFCHFLLSVIIQFLEGSRNWQNCSALVQHHLCILMNLVTYFCNRRATHSLLA
jgi:hypothetical protein